MRQIHNGLIEACIPEGAVKLSFSQIMSRSNLCSVGANLLRLCLITVSKNWMSKKFLQVMYFISVCNCLIFVGWGYFFSEFYGNKHFYVLLCLRTFAPLFVGSVFAWSISKGYKHGFPLDNHLTFLSLSVVCLLCILFSCMLPKRLNNRKAVPVRVWSCENSCKRWSSSILGSCGDNNSPLCPNSNAASVKVELHLAGRPVKSLVADVYTENSYPREARK